MSLESGELVEIQKQIEQEFTDDPVIQVTPGDGDPPSQYEIHYKIPCTSIDDEGNITITSGHTVTISIPFGFPHFPPSCKPKSSIFHPDFDSAAICLGEFWHRDQSIPALIKYIGQMLSGEIYSAENAFNEKAAEWFRDNSEQLPFSASTPTPTEPPPAEAADEDEPFLELDDLNEEELGTLDDDDFSDDFDFADDFPAIEPEEIADSPDQESAPATDELGFDSGLLSQLARQGNYHQLRDELSSLPEHIDFSEKGQLQESAEEKLQEAKRLYEEAENYENDGLSHKALEGYRAVANIVADYPNIKNDIQRSEQAAAMLEDISGIRPDGQAPDPTTLSEEAGDQKQPDPTVTAKASAVETEEAQTEPVFFEETSKRPFNIIPLVAGGLLFCLAATLTYMYFSLSSRLTEAKQLYSECTASFTEKEFHAAEQACKSSLDIAQSIYLIHQSAVSDLVANNRKILNSEELRQGLLGKVLHEGKYIMQDKLEGYLSFDQAILQGDGFNEEESWEKAAGSYSKALALGNTLEDIPAESFLEIEQKLNYVTFRSRLTEAEGYVTAEDWQSAASTLNSLQKRLESLEPSKQAIYRKQIDALTAKGLFVELKEQGDKLFSQSDWDGAYDFFIEAIAAGRALSGTDSGELDTLHENAAKAELYSTINSGNVAFAAGQWQNAIAMYLKAKEMINSNAEKLKIPDTKQSKLKIDRIILQSSILRDHQKADLEKEAGNLQEALQYLEKVRSHITTSKFGDDPEFKEIFQETKQATNTLKANLFIAQKKQYLVNNYLTLFLKNYPAARPETLSQPVATFEKRLGKLYLFKLQCTETGRGRPLKLIMFYSYNPDNGRWKFYSENS